MSAVEGTATVRLGTRWRRTAVLAGAATAALVAMTGMVRGEVLAASVSYQGAPSSFATGRVSGDDVAFGMVRAQVRDADGTLREVAVLRAGFATATLDGFCLSQKQTLPVLGAVTIKLTAGDGDASTQEITATNVEFDVLDLRGSGTGVNLDGVVQIGPSSLDVTTLPGVENPLDAPAGTGYLGIDATRGDIHEARGRIHDAEIGGPIAMPDLRITVVPGDRPCSGDSLPH